jgi:hypothetical protein
MNLNNIKKNMCALFVAMTAAATSYAAQDPHMPWYISDMSAGTRPIYAAALTNNTESAANILAATPEMARVSVNLDDVDPFWTPLCEAARSGSTQVAELLIQNGADARDGRALFMAAENGHLDTLQLLLGLESDMDKGYLLIGGAREGHVHVVEFLINGQFDISSDYLKRAFNCAENEETKRVIKSEALRRKRGPAVWMASNFASPNVLNHVPEDVARWITSSFF